MSKYTSVIKKLVKKDVFWLTVIAAALFILLLVLYGYFSSLPVSTDGPWAEYFAEHPELANGALL